MDFNWLDLLIGGILLVSFVAALRNGVTREIVRIVALLAGIVGAMWFYERGALSLRPTWPAKRWRSLPLFFRS